MAAKKSNKKEKWLPANGIITAGTYKYCARLLQTVLEDEKKAFAHWLEFEMVNQTKDRRRHVRRRYEKHIKALTILVEQFGSKFKTAEEYDYINMEEPRNRMEGIELRKKLKAQAKFGDGKAPAWMLAKKKDKS